jgi:hypothetical protein
MEYDDLDLPVHGAKQDVYLKAAEKYINKLSEKRKNKVRIIFGHSVPFGIHKFFKKFPRYFTIFRDPVDRVVSQYNYLLTTYKRENASGKKNPLYKALLIKGKVPSFRKWVGKRYSATEWKNVNKTTFEFLNELGYLKGTSLKELKDRFFFVGLKKNFEQDSLYLYYLLGFNKFFINENVSKKYVKYSEREKIYDFAPEKFKDSIKLFKNAEKYNSELRKKSEYKDSADKMKLKRFFYLPITQILYGLSDLKREVKNKIKDNLIQ